MVSIIEFIMMMVVSDYDNYVGMKFCVRLLRLLGIGVIVMLLVFYCSKLWKVSILFRLMMNDGICSLVVMKLLIMLMVVFVMSIVFIVS